MKRRQLGIVSVLALGAAVAGCQGLTSATIPNAVVSDLALVKNGLSVVIGAAQGLGLPVAIGTAITNYATTSIQLISTVAVGMAQSVGQPIVTQIQTDVNAAISALTDAGVTIPATITKIINALNTLLPVVMVAVGILTAGATEEPGAIENARGVLSAV